METLPEFYAQVETDPEPLPRHHVFLEEYRRHRARLGGGPIDVLDVGCGDPPLFASRIDPADRYHGTDIKPALSFDLPDYRRVDLNEDTLTDVFAGKSFEVVFCGEVIEHVFSPDRLLRQLASVMDGRSLLVLSTPNLAYWLNRVLLIAGIVPLFLENSAEVKLGRRARWLGEGNGTQGHIRVFSHRAMLALLAREGFEVLGVRSVPVWAMPVDKLVCRLSPNLAQNNVYLLRRR